MNKFLAFALIVGGIIVGLYFPELAGSLSFLGKIFLKALKLIVIPIVFVSLFLALISLEKEELKKLGGGTFLYYGLTSLLACLTGFMTAQLFDFSQMSLDNSLMSNTSTNLQSFSLQDMVLSFVPSNIFESLAEGNIVQVVVISLFMGISSLYLNDESKESLHRFAKAVNEILEVFIKGIMYLSPIGIASLLASLFSEFDTSLFDKLIKLFIAITVAASIHLLISLPSLGKLLGRFSPFNFMWKMRKAMGLALVTASSSATLPVSIQELESQTEVKSKTARFVLPLGATLNMDGSALYQSLVIFFFAGVAGIELTLVSEFTVIFVVMISSAGTAGIPAGGMVMMGAVMEMVGIPLDYLALYVLIDRFWDYPITMLNVCGDLFAARTVDRFIK